MTDPSFEDVTQAVDAFVEALKSLADYFHGGGDIEVMPNGVRDAAKIAADFFGEGDADEWLRSTLSVVDAWLTRG